MPKGGRGRECDDKVKGMAVDGRNEEEEEGGSE